MVGLAQGNPDRIALFGRLNAIDSELSQASRTLSECESGVASLDASIGGLSSRLASVRGHGYSALAHLDKTIDLLSKKWTEVGGSVKQAVANDLQPLQSQIRGLQSETQTLRSEIDSGNFGAAQGLANRLSGDAASVRVRASEAAIRATLPIKDLTSGLGVVDRDLKVAESTVTLFGQAGFPMVQEESPILAVQGKMMEGEKLRGTIYFTNHRFLFEGTKEVVLEKKLFIVTKKRLDRVVIIDKPVGAVKEISKGRVGLIAGTGVYVEFKPEVGLSTTPFDVRGEEADVVTRFFKYITGGEADRDIATVRGVSAPSTPSIKLARCVSCGAPYTGEIYQGQTSLKCEYCGASVAIS